MGGVASRLLREARELFAEAVRLWHCHPHNPFAVPPATPVKLSTPVAPPRRHPQSGMARARQRRPCRLARAPRQRPRPRPGLPHDAGAQTGSRAATRRGFRPPSRRFAANAPPTTLSDKHGVQCYGGSRVVSQAAAARALARRPAADRAVVSARGLPCHDRHGERQATGGEARACATPIRRSHRALLPLCGDRNRRGCSRVVHHYGPRGAVARARRVRPRAIDAGEWPHHRCVLPRPLCIVPLEHDGAHHSHIRPARTRVRPGLPPRSERAHQRQPRRRPPRRVHPGAPRIVLHAVSAGRRRGAFGMRPRPRQRRHRIQRRVLPGGAALGQLGMYRMWK